MMTRLERELRYTELMRTVGSSGFLEAARPLALTDLYFLLAYILKRKDLRRDWLYERCMEVQVDSDGYLDLWAREHYKALDVETPVWTMEGWKRHGDLRFGDCIFSPSGRIVRVIANTGPMEGADCFDVGGVVAAGDHLWPVQIKHRVRVPGGRAVRYETVVSSTRDMGAARLPNVLPLDGVEPAGLVVPPYVLGVWLGDGHSACGRVTNADEEIWGLLGWESRCGSVLITRNLPGLMPHLRALGVLNNKHIPREYLTLPPAGRRALLQGLMDTDGAVNTRGTATFCNTNEDLVDGVALLANSLGMRSHKRRYEGYWQVSFQAYQGEYCPFRLMRKRDRCKPGSPNMRFVTPVPIATRPVNCIQVEGGLYLAGEQFLPTHNSTIITFGLTIQNILANPELTVGIFSHTRPIAKGFLRQIMREFEGNDTLKAMFPGVLFQHPRKESPKWSEDDGIIVKRKGNPKESTVEAWGLVDGQPTSKHYALMVYDDVVTRESVTTPDMINKVNEAWELSRSLAADGGRTRYIGTRYHFNDTYRLMMERKAAEPRIYPATKDGKPDGEPVLMDKVALVQRRREQGPYTFASQMLQDPTADSAQGFRKEWLNYADVVNHAGLSIVILVDPASEKKRTSDYTVMMVVGIGADKNYYVLDMIRDRLNLTERGDKLMMLHRMYRPVAVGYEKYGLQADIEFVQYIQAQQNYRFKISPLGGQMPKNDRIRRLIPICEQRRLFLPRTLLYVDYQGKSSDLVRDFVKQEFLPFPVAVHDDMLDCLARVLDPEISIPAPSSNGQARTINRRVQVAI